VTRFAREKLLRLRAGRCEWLGSPVGGYEIRHGRVEPVPGADARGGGDTGADARDAGHGSAGEPLFVADDGEPEGWRVGPVLGTSWHGVLEHDAFRGALLAHVAALRGRRFRPGTVAFAQAREARLDVLGDLVAQHLDTGALARLIEEGVPAELPSVATEVRACCAS
jgi:adenosylcobyric acid synthase